MNPRSELSYLAAVACRVCAGTGVRPLKRTGRGGVAPPSENCPCVLRAAFRSCYARFRLAFLRGRHCRGASYDRTAAGPTNRGMWSRQEEEYMADFDLVARRYLDAPHYKIFRYYFLLGAGWRLCSQKLGVERGRLYHAVYRIEEKLGQAFTELQPYPLYPPREYFALHRQEPVKPIRQETPETLQAEKLRRIWRRQLAG